MSDGLNQWAIARGESVITLTRRWSSERSAIGSVLAALVAMAVIGHELTQVDSAEYALDNLAWTLPLFFLVSIFIVFLFLVYYELCRYVNATTVTVDRAAIAIRHAPLPAGGQIMIPASRVKQIIVARKEGKAGAGGVRYHLGALDHDERVTGLLVVMDADLAARLGGEIAALLGVAGPDISGE